MHRIPFSAENRKELLKLGVSSQAIECIEIEALTTASRFLRVRPRKNDVRNELQGLQDALTKARDAIERMLDATPAVPHLREAQAILAAGLGRRIMGGIRLNETSKSLSIAIEMVERGIDKMPPGPTRHRLADPYPVELIHDALQKGSLFATGDPESHRLKPSASPTSRFRRLIGICYETIGAPHEPERAVKAYVKKWRALHKYFADQGLVTERTKKT